MDGQWIYQNFQDGQGPDGLVGGAAIVNEVAADYDSRAQQIRSLMARMESGWQGEAAGAAHRGAGPMAHEHELSGPSLATAQDLTNRQAGSYSDAKNAVVPVPPKPELANPLVVFSSPAEWSRFEDQVDDYNAAAQHNVAPTVHGCEHFWTVALGVELVDGEPLASEPLHEPFKFGKFTVVAGWRAGHAALRMVRADGAGAPVSRPAPPAHVLWAICSCSRSSWRTAFHTSRTWPRSDRPQGRPP